MARVFILSLRATETCGNRVFILSLRATEIIGFLVGQERSAVHIESESYRDYRFPCEAREISW